MILGKYNQSKTVTFDLIQVDGIDIEVAATFATGDVVIMKDEGAEANTTNLPTDEGTGYSLVLTATEMSAARIRIYIIDQTATKVWLDISLGIETYGNASAEHAFDLDTSSTAQTGDNFARLGAPAGASVSADLVVIDNFVDGLESTIGTAGAGLTDITINAASVDLVWDEVLTGASHNVAASSGRRLRGIQEFQGYEAGRVYIDTVSGAAGTVDYENGTVENAVLTFADALTIAASLSLHNYNFSNDSTLTLAANITNANIYGVGYTLDFAGFDISGAHFFHASPVNGIALTATDHGDILDSIIASVTVDDIHFTNCTFTGTVTMGSVSSTLRVIRCQSVGSTAPIFDFGIVAAVAHNLNMADYVGHIDIRNMGTAGTDTMRVDGGGGTITFNANCAAGTVYINGDWTVVNNGSVTIVRDDTNTQLNARTPTASQLAYMTDHAATAPQVTFASGSTTTAVLTNVDGVAASAVDSFYNNRLLVFTNSTLQHQVSQITAYVGSTKTATITTITTGVLSSHTALLV